MPGCQRLTNKMYSTRPGPPYAAQSCRGKKAFGNDGLLYKSVPASNGVYRWIKAYSVSATSRKVAKPTKTSSKRRQKETTRASPKKSLKANKKVKKNKSSRKPMQRRQTLLRCKKLYANGDVVETRVKTAKGWRRATARDNLASCRYD